MKLSHASIAVTGATGFLGKYLIEALLAHGASPVAVVRNPEKARTLRNRGVEVRAADLGDRRALQAAFEGTDAVVANAGVISFTRPRAARQANVEGTRNVFEAMAAAGIRRAVAISSTAVYPPSLRVRDESCPLRRSGPLAWNVYGASKAEAERLAWELASQYEINLTTFRPSGITAPDDPLLMRSLHRLMGKRVAPLPVFARIGVVHAADVAGAVCQALAEPQTAGGKAYNLQGQTVSFWEMTDSYLRAGGHGPRLRIPVPLPFSLRYDDGRARRELAFSPRSVDTICSEALANR